MGVLGGTWSLAVNGIEGTFGSLQQISQGLSKTLLAINQDSDYLSRREEKLLTEKPKDFVEGLGYGCSNAIESVKSGVTGVFTRPVKEARRGGAKGFLFGTF